MHVCARAAPVDMRRSFDGLNAAVERQAPGHSLRRVSLAAIESPGTITLPKSLDWCLSRLSQLLAKTGHSEQ